MKPSCEAFVYAPTTSNGFLCQSSDKDGIYQDFQLCTFDKGIDNSDVPYNICLYKQILELKEILF